MSVKSWSKDARGEVVGERGDEVFVSRGEFDKAGEVSGYSVECCYVGEAQLAKGILKDRDSSRRIRFGGC